MGCVWDFGCAARCCVSSATVCPPCENKRALSGRAPCVCVSLARRIVELRRCSARLSGPYSGRSVGFPLLFTSAAAVLRYPASLLVWLALALALPVGLLAFAACCSAWLGLACLVLHTFPVASLPGRLCFFSYITASPALLFIFIDISVHYPHFSLHSFLYSSSVTCKDSLRVLSWLPCALRLEVHCLVHSALLLMSNAPLNKWKVKY